MSTLPDVPSLVLVREGVPMVPVAVTPRLSVVVLSQAAAERRLPEPSSALLSITGVGWKAFESPHEEAYSKGVLRLVLDDVAANLDDGAMERLRRDVREVIAMARRLDGLGEHVTLVVHCHAGMSRSTAFAVGCAASVADVSLDSVVAALRDGVAGDARKFMPNPLILREFEDALALQEGTLARHCALVSNEFQTWVEYWRRKATGGAVGVLCLLASSAVAQDVRPPMVIERGLSAHALVPCGRESKPPPDCGLDVNSASETALTALPGMDPVTAARIVRGRPYGRAGDVMERGIMTTTTFDMARSYLWVMRASLNSSTPDELVARLGIPRDKAAGIVSKRPWINVDDLAFQGIMSMSELDRLRPLLSLR